MTTVPAAIVALAVLAAAGLVPAAALTGPRLVSLPLLPLIGAAIAALAATGYAAVGGSFLGWFVALAAASALAVFAVWWLRPDLRPWHASRVEAGVGGWPRVVGAVGAVAILAACGWCLRGLATPTVGFDARALWLMRAGWFLQSHHQFLIKMRVPDLVLVQTPYPPLVSASTAVAWGVTGNQSMRLGVVVVAVLNTCALAVAAYALVEAGRQVARRLASGGRRVPLAPVVVGAVAAALVIFVAFGITEPFMTNGYADPLWSLAALGAVAYGLQLGSSPVNQGVALILVVVAGLSKDEGVVTAAALIVLVGARSLLALPPAERRRRWWQPVVIGLAELAAVSVWPLLMRAIGARGETSITFSPLGAMPGRARTVFDGMVPYLHVIVVAVPLAVVGGLVLSRVRRRSGVANDGWAWAGLISGLFAVSGAYITGTADIQVWLVGTVDRVTEFPALVAWWIVAMWAVVASGALSPADVR